jgi:hypothetical protein
VCFFGLSKKSYILIVFHFSPFQDVDKKSQHTAAIIESQKAQLVQLEKLYKQEEVLRKQYYNIVEGTHEYIVHT